MILGEGYSSFCSWRSGHCSLMSLMIRSHLKHRTAPGLMYFKQHQTAHCRVGPEMSGWFRYFDSVQFCLRVPGLWCDEFLGTDCSFCRIQNHCQPHGSGTRTLRCSFEGCVDICWPHFASSCVCMYVMSIHIHVMYLHVLFTHKGAYKCVCKCFAPTQYQDHTNIYKLLKSLLDESKRAWSFYFQGSSAIKSQGPCLNWRRHASWTSDDVHVFLPGGILWFLDNT